MDTSRIIEIVAEQRASARAFLGAGESAQTALLPALLAIQEEFGHVDAKAIPLIADELNISQAEVRGVVSFYHDIRVEASARHHLKLCRAEACQAMGSERIAGYAASRHQLDPGAHAHGGALAIENVYCLGNCALAPAAMLDENLIGRFDEARLDAIVTAARAGARTGALK